MKINKFMSAAIAVIFLSVALPSFANTLYPPSLDPHNQPPPSGAILDLAGTPITSTYSLYSVGFTASLTNTDVTFAFRNDPSFTYFDDASIVDVTHPSGNLFVNPGFEFGSLTPGWTYDNVYGAPFGGSVGTSCVGVSPHGGTYLWCDGATQAYDAIDQIVSTTPGDHYLISFYQGADGFGSTTYQQISTNGCVDTSDNSSSCSGGIGGNGIDTLVYVGSTIPAAVPEPATISLFVTGLIGVGLKRFTRNSRSS